MSLSASGAIICGVGAHMYDLLTRTISQGLQALLPIAFALAWFRRAGNRDATAGLRWGLAAALPATLFAMYGFQHSTRQSLVEAVMAAGACLLAIWFTRRAARGVPATMPPARPRQSRIQFAFAIAAVVVLVRQTMEIAVALGAALELRAADPLIAITIGTAVSVAAALLWLRISTRLSNEPLVSATTFFASFFAAQAAFYAFHESAEAGLLPWSDVLHAATEPYGPDGFYGRYVSAALLVVPVIAALGRRRAAVDPRDRQIRRPAQRLAPAVIVAAVLLVAGIEVLSLAGRTRPASPAARVPADSADRGIAAVATAPHLLFRTTMADPNYGRLSAVPLASQSAATRAASGMECERISFASGRGICLTADRGMFTTFEARLFDARLAVTHTIRIAGSPTRTRVSPDGRVGAITVFTGGAGHKYEGSAFSTRTTILDMTTGDLIGELESFATWRDGKRFKAADFNFWGVTFARDSNTFYATLKSAGRTYLVRGDLGLRKLTVLRENVECPALSPDNRLIGFKKRIGTGSAPWRFYVLDLATLSERPIAAETRSIDDQLEWLDDAHVLYGVPRANQPASLDVWTAPVDGTGAARIFLADAESPIVVR